MSKYLDATIRIVQSSDYEGVTRFFDENNRPEITKHFHPFPLTSLTAYNITCTDHLDRYFVAIWKSKIIGLCMLRGWDEGFDIPSFGILVDHRFRRCGLGRRMTEFVIGEAYKLHCKQIRLSVYASNIYAIRLYISLGFRENECKSVVVAGEPDLKLIMVKDME